MAAALELTGIVKSFPGVQALRGVGLKLEAGTIHALLGENGAGKSTLIKIITGVHQPDDGEIRIAGSVKRLLTPLQAIAAGIGVVHQERNLIPNFSVAENILFDRIARSSLSPLNYTELGHEAERWLALLGLRIDPRQPVSALNMATAQMVEIVRALSQQSQVLLMDEPTASLTPHETETLFGVLRRLRDQGVAIIFVSHKLEEVVELCDALTVLRDGTNACASRPLSGLGRSDIVSLMIGRTEPVLDLGRVVPEKHGKALTLAGVSTELGHFDISFDLRKGVILGMYGLVGAGRSELVRAVMGLARITGGHIEIDGMAAKISGPNDALHRFGIGYVSEDRKHEGVIISHGVLANAGMTVWRRLIGPLRVLRDRKIANLVKPVLTSLELKAASMTQEVGQLSGGNQQKVSLAKWLAAGVRVLIVDEPTTGIDIKAKAYLHQLLHRLAREGLAILVISSDMPELISLADEIVVMDRYRIANRFRNTGSYAEVSQAIMASIHPA
jgi:ribose transport system ATP-binding protein